MSGNEQKQPGFPTQQAFPSGPRPPQMAQYPPMNTGQIRPAMVRGQRPAMPQPGQYYAHPNPNWQQQHHQPQLHQMPSPNARPAFSSPQAPNLTQQLPPGYKHVQMPQYHDASGQPRQIPYPAGTSPQQGGMSAGQRVSFDGMPHPGSAEAAARQHQQQAWNQSPQNGMQVNRGPSGNIGSPPVSFPQQSKLSPNGNTSINSMMNMEHMVSNQPQYLSMPPPTFQGQQRPAGNPQQYAQQQPMNIRFPSSATPGGGMNGPQMTPQQTQLYQQLQQQQQRQEQSRQMPPTFSGSPSGAAEQDLARKRQLMQHGMGPSEDAMSNKRQRIDASGSHVVFPQGQGTRHYPAGSAQPPQQMPTKITIKPVKPAPAPAKGKGKAAAPSGSATDDDSNLDLDVRFPIQAAQPAPRPRPVVSRQQKKVKTDPNLSSDPSDFDENDLVNNQWTRLFLDQTDNLRRQRIEFVINDWAEAEKQEVNKYQRKISRRWKKFREITKAPIVDENGEVHPSIDEVYPPVNKQENKQEYKVEKSGRMSAAHLWSLVLDVSDDEQGEPDVFDMDYADYDELDTLDRRIYAPRELEEKRSAVWDSIVKHMHKGHNLMRQSISIREYNSRKVAQLCEKQAKRMGVTLRRLQRELPARQRKVTKDMQVFWRKNEKEERDRQKRAEKERQDERKREEEAREARRQQKKLNFLIQQTELYAHFVAKIQDKTLGGAASQPAGSGEPSGGAVDFKAINFDEESDEALAKRAEESAQAAFDRTKERTRVFDQETRELRAANEGVDELSFQNPTLMPSSMEITQPNMLTVQLKAYQLKGLNWLANLWESGINGILADEMGLGKTIQSISVIAHLAEIHNIWGPFLVIAPLSTLHNWQQELTKFTPTLRVLPYWGKAEDRKVLRKFWARKKLYTKDAPFHVLITSYQIISKDEKYFQKVKWQYMILDEAQAIKSSLSQRWTQLQKLHARNKLLLTGTPIQNSMQELWALLHFIMPTLFDSHEEFSEWFSKDIEGSAKDMNTLNEQQLKRLHMILRPFMLRRIKRDVENELGEKVEIDVSCALTPRQKKLYKGLREKLSTADLLDRLTMLGEKESGDSLMNLVMQFRKVCNHPDLFERAPVDSPLVMFRSNADPILDHIRTGAIANWVNQPAPNPIQLFVPRLVYEEVGLAGLGHDDDRGHVMDHLLNIFHPLHVNDSLKDLHSGFGFLRFSDLSPSEANRITKEGTFRRIVALLLRNKRQQRLAAFDDLEENPAPTSSALLISPHNPLSAEKLSETEALKAMCSVSDTLARDSRLQREAPTYKPPILAAPIDVVCPSRSFVYDMDDLLWDGTSRGLLSGVEQLLPGGRKDPRNADLVRVIEDETNGTGLLGPAATTQGYSHIWIPETEKMVYDSGKMMHLDNMLPKLKAEGHRVLIFFQMVKMMDLIEEYLTFRNYSYLRLDGQTTITDRNAMVYEFQNNPEVFIFLLSTRAGGLGINLTAADTVIFYDSDWNPTVDQQAMDRSHRLGQTKQVTVYRLITAGTIEERIMQRAKQKDQVQKVVISGGGFQQQVDFKPRDIAALLLDDEELEQNLAKREAERALEGTTVRRGRPPVDAAKRKRDDGTDAGDSDMVGTPGSGAAKKRRRGAQSWAQDELADDDMGDGSAKPKAKRGRKPKAKISNGEEIEID